MLDITAIIISILIFLLTYFHSKIKEIKISLMLKDIKKDMDLVKVNFELTNRKISANIESVERHIEKKLEKNHEEIMQYIGTTLTESLIDKIRLHSNTNNSIMSTT